MIPVKLVMRKEILSINVKTPVWKAAKLMEDRNVGSLLIKRGGSNVGILTETDIVQKVVAAGLDPATTQVGDVMSTPLITIEAKESVVDADELMERQHIRHLVVTERGKVVGVASVRDLLFPLQYLLVFANMDTEKESALMGEEVIQGIKRASEKRQRKKPKSPRRRINKSL